MSRQLSIERKFDLPLAEISGLALSRGHLHAVGDEAFVIARAPFDNASLGAVDRSDVAHLLGQRRGGSQWEAVTCDGAGRVLVMQETPGTVFVFDPKLGALLASIELTESDAIEGDWARGKNSRGEGLVPLANGHLFVVKEKDPPVLFEFGPACDAPVGLTPASGAFQLPPGGHAQFVPLAAWSIDDRDREELEDLSDAALAPDGALYLLSDQARAIVRVDSRLDRAGGVIAIGARWDLPKKVKKPEGLVVTADAVLVAIDREEEKNNLFLLSGLAA